VRRHLIGLIALALLVGAVYFWLHPSAAESAWGLQLQAACWRLGALTSILWLAWPQLHRVPPWVFGAILVPLLILAVRPRLIFLAVPIVIVLAILRPKFGRAGRDR